MEFKEEVKKKFYEYKLKNKKTDVEMAELIGINKKTLANTIKKDITLEKNWYIINNFLESQEVKTLTETKEIIENIKDPNYDLKGKISFDCNLGKITMSYKDAMEIALTVLEATDIRTPEVDLLIEKADREYGLDLY